jgi:hypothetical protein
MQPDNDLTQRVFGCAIEVHRTFGSGLLESAYEACLCHELDQAGSHLGADHPNVAIRLSNLAQLLQATNRLAEAEPRIGRAALIYLAFERQTGHTHPYRDTAFAWYRHTDGRGPRRSRGPNGD